MANIQGKDKLVEHHSGKNIMTKMEDYIKPLILKTNEVNADELNQIRLEY